MEAKRKEIKKRREVKSTKGVKKKPNLIVNKSRTNWLLSHIGSASSTLPIQYKIPIIFFSGYVVTLMMAISLIGILLNEMLSTFEDEILRRGIGRGFADLSRLNTTTLSSLRSLESVTVEQGYTLPDQTKIASYNSVINSLTNQLANQTTEYTQLSLNHSRTRQRIDSVNQTIPIALFQLNRLISRIEIYQVQYNEVANIFSNSQNIFTYGDNIFNPIGSYYFQATNLTMVVSNGWQLLNFSQDTFIRLLYNTEVYRGGFSPTQLMNYVYFTNHELRSDRSIQIARDLITTDTALGYLLRVRPTPLSNYRPASYSCRVWRKG